MVLLARPFSGGRLRRGSTVATTDAKGLATFKLSFAAGDAGGYRLLFGTRRTLPADPEQLWEAVRRALLGAAAKLQPLLQQVW